MLGKRFVVSEVSRMCGLVGGRRVVYFAFVNVSRKCFTGEGAWFAWNLTFA